MTADTDQISAKSVLEIWRSRVDFQGIILGVICTLVTLLLLIGARMTADAIALRTTEDRMAILNQVLPADSYDNEPLHDVVRIKDSHMANGFLDVYVARRQGEFTGAAFQIQTDGYGGPITLMMGIDKDGVIRGVRVLTHKETPGLADKIEINRNNWITTFDGRSLDNTSKPHWAVKKDGGDFDQFTGATITPRAMVRGVYEGLQFFTRQQSVLRVKQPVSESGG